MDVANHQRFHHGELIENTTMKALLSKLDVETFILDLDRCAGLPELTGVVSQQVNSDSLEIAVEKSQGLNHVFAQLSECGITVLSMRNKANRLEELFVNIVKEQ